MSKQYTQEEVLSLNAQLEKIAKQVRKLLDSHEFETAKHILLTQALNLVPNHQIVLSDLAYCEKKLNNPLQAYRYLMQALDNNTVIDPEVYDSLTSTCFSMKRFEEARYYAKLSLRRKKELLVQLPPEIFPLPAEKAPGLSHDKRKNIICFSLFGSSPRYCETSVLNVELAKKIYPEWTCRFYLDESVPAEVVLRLEKAGAEIIKVTPAQKKISGLFWRFFIFDDPSVQCFIIRDADSMLSYKEKAAVEQWLSSGKWFHIMRDALEHSELILAGMWGGYSGIFGSIENLSEKFYRKLKVLNKTIDQHFLRTLYPTVAQSVLIHDNYLLDPDSHVFPDYPLSDIEKLPYFHIGMIDSSINTASFSLKEKSHVNKVRWYLKNQQNQEICSYISPVKEREGEFVVDVNLPYFYSQQIAQGNWHFSYSILGEHNSSTQMA
ncbi:hypothetical protein EIM44_08435 [Bibersteinia trehalosi]|uniref:Tetratricopeptide repeat protein n=1 Tax=Bibersteinia trehalosi TaxID=47735 RepID=A0A426FFB4_BIBTR|nr:hypothetical protein [Bibersteinia trehalosi]RRN01547.1 hypothetical protein EIM44_08435 [Bibersteinia trehalosi]